MNDVAKHISEFNAVLEIDPGEEVIQKLRQIPEKIKIGEKRKQKPDRYKSKRSKLR